MELKLSEEDDRSRNTKDAYSEKSEGSDLIFSFDSDSETENNTLVTAPQQPCDKSSTYTSEYVMIPRPGDGIDRGRTLTGIHTSDSLDWLQISRRDDKRRKIETPSTSPFLLLPPDDNCNNSASITPDSSSLHLDIPREPAACAPIPEPATPRTRRFKDDMLSLLSLLPPGRYLSPSPSIEENQFEEADAGECGLDACAVSPILPVHAATVDCSSRNLSLSKPPPRPQQPLPRTTSGLNTSKFFKILGGDQGREGKGDNNKSAVMCQQHDIFYMCGCRVIDKVTGEWAFEIERCKKGLRRRRNCEKIEMALPRWKKDTYCDDPDCPAYDDDD
ncbi:hypothetical protein GGR51DRAFT_558201 [Nemania sp. FL0031]|nr:hypothetical protein GGR51DRAFT_558201 [Nemania sp. FL0031]